MEEALRMILNNTQDAVRSMYNKDNKGVAPLAANVIRAVFHDLLIRTTCWLKIQKVCGSRSLVMMAMVE